MYSMYAWITNTIIGFMVNQILSWNMNNTNYNNNYKKIIYCKHGLRWGQTKNTTCECTVVVHKILLVYYYHKSGENYFILHCTVNDMQFDENWIEPRATYIST